MRAPICMCVVCGVTVGALNVASGQEIGPAEVIDTRLPVSIASADGAPTLATGAIGTIAGCDFCFLYATQYRVTVPEGVVRLVVELIAENPLADIDLLIREA
jgi:hypothetical protein